MKSAPCSEGVLSPGVPRETGYGERNRGRRPLQPAPNLQEWQGNSVRSLTTFAL